MVWTKQQKQAIELRKRNILVAAAAGSGKTAVLVERIIRMITEGEKPIDIDRLLMVTFTNAAAAQMRERIGQALEKKIEQEPDNIHLQRQITLLHHAKITTIHSFCLNLVRNHFDRLDIDPDFRIADEGEIKLLKADVMKQLLEDCYVKGKKEFFAFVESYAQGKSDSDVEELIEELYEFSQGYPFPETQLERWRREISCDTPEELEKTLWMKCLLEDVHLQARELGIQCEDAIESCQEPDGPWYYEPMFLSDYEMIKALQKANTYSDISNILYRLNFVRKPVKKDASVDEGKKKQLSDLRDQIKKSLQAMQKQYCVTGINGLLADLEQTKEPLGMLIELAAEFGRRFLEAKKEKNIADFGDLEHFALQILVEEGEPPEPTEVADELSREFEEILVDEYQDSNRVQELILTAVSKERFSQPNMFMVGDVKQSIYKFRLARPELFMEKYETYISAEDGQGSLYQKIDLHQNFRSRSEVLEGINYIFRQIMTKNLGNITYDDAAALYPGASYPDSESELSTELLLVNPDEEVLDELEEKAADYHVRELEAKAIAARIKELTDKESGFQVFDKNSGEMRGAQYRDIVILLRTFSGWAELFVNTLTNAGIPAFAESQTGYFTALEVKTILNFLRVLDNPMQDIPLAAVLKSPIVGMTSKQLAVMVGEFKTMKKIPTETFQEQVVLQSWPAGLYGAVLYYSEQGKAETIKNILIHFLDMLKNFRKKAMYMRLDELIQTVLDETGYGLMVCAMPQGRVRSANLEMLVQKAVEFENTSYHGLFNFIRYIEGLQKYSIDFGEASSAGENENIVRITSIHKSKGLEFPVVIVAGMGKKFNLNDSRGKVLLHPDLGIAADCIDLENRTKAETLPKQVFKRQMNLESMGEELRILYVALTRAKEKLIMAGCERHLESKLVRWSVLCSGQKEELPFTVLTSAQCYLDWVLMGLMRHRCMEEILRDREVFLPDFYSLSASKAGFIVKIIGLGEILAEEVKRLEKKDNTKEELTNWNTEIVYDKEAAKEINERLSFRYRFQDSVSMHEKVSVSELKRMDIPEEEADILIESHEKTVLEYSGEIPLESVTGILRPIPEFMKEKVTVSGVFKGTALHRIMQLLVFSEQKNRKAVEASIESLLVDNRITQDVYDCVNRFAIAKFFSSSVAQRMARAEKQGKLRREQAFVLAMRAEEIGGTYKGDEQILIQGIIDAWFEEDGLVIVDYKTDAVAKGKEEELVKKYRIQLEYYKRALERLTGKQVKEKIIYSFALQKEIQVE